ncbi:family 16 glycosylhydrolase [Bradyrhizobium sp. USDA 3650]
MNLTKPLRASSRILHYLLLKLRRRLPRRQSNVFVSGDSVRSGVSQIYVINLDRQPERWIDVLSELGCVLDSDGISLTERTRRYSAIDAQSASDHTVESKDIDPFYTLADQLYVEPQPLALPDEFDLARPIRMSKAEIAIACSHISVWRDIAQSAAPYALVVEDDVWLKLSFARVVDQAWQEMKSSDQAEPAFDMLYLSYAEARHGAPKELISRNLFRPERGLWFLSGYVLSKNGAQALLNLLPCRGPIDLWINQKFQEIDVRALRRPVIHQRADLLSTNSYSILPSLAKIGVIDHGSAALFHQRPHHFPVFAFGKPGTGLSSLAMALSMLGYRCCSDVDRISEVEFHRLLAGSRATFDAYVNVGQLVPELHKLVLRYPHGKFIVTGSDDGGDTYIKDLLEALKRVDVAILEREDARTWRVLCEHLRLSPPVATYPVIPEIGQRKYRETAKSTLRVRARPLRYDRMPWIVESGAGWDGINAITTERLAFRSRVVFDDDLSDIRSARWLLRSDTFPGNLGLFRPANVSARSEGGASFAVRRESLGVREFSAAAISSRESFLYGRFEATLQATNVSGLVTGFFLYRASPRQEIDIEIAGNRPTCLVVNVFYNPGSEGAKFDYGYRGTPVAISLGFDASKALHRYAIEWDPCEIRWLVDGNLVHRRGIWNPTPIPHLPMTLHANTWPSRSQEFAGHLAVGRLPGSASIRDITVDANKVDI